MFKKISAALMVIVMAASMVSLSAFAAPEKIVFERIDEYATAYVKVNATNNTSDDAQVNVIAVYTDENDKITAISQSGNVSITQGDTETITVEIEDMSADSTLSYYVWDGAEIRTPLENSAPVPSTEISSPDQTLTTVQLEWNDGDDDYKGVTSYNVYNMGIFLGNTSDNSFTVTNQERGVETNYSVKAVDDEGLESAQAITQSFITKNIPTVICADAVNNGSVQYADTTQTSSYGSTDKLAEYEGLPCRVTKNVGNPKITTHGFKFSQEYADKLAGVRNITIIITYFDEFLYNENDSDAVKKEKNKISLGYCRTNENSANSMSGGKTIATITGSNQWKTAVVNVGDAYFELPSTDGGSAYAKFRIIAGPSVGSANAAPGLKIYSCSVIPTAEYNELMKEATGRVKGAYINDGIEFNDKADGIEKVQLDGKGAVKVTAGNNLECDVTTTAIADSSTVTVEVEYYTQNPYEDIVFTHSYDGNDPIIVPATATGQWQRARFELTDASFTNSMAASQIANADFTIGTASGSEFYIHSVRAYIPQ